MRANKRSVNGILLLDKPKGLSSNQALQSARRIFNAEKAGHAGTLDPMATGLLPVLFGEASKFADSGLNAHKHYDAVIKLGISTTTADAMGEVIEQHTVPEISYDQLNHVQLHFKGNLQQVPPMYSALKQNGVPLYRMARQGEMVERQARPITIHDISLVKLDHEHLELKVFCSKGTYIRTLAEDIGKSVGCAAHLVSLRRTRVGSLQGDMHTLDSLSNAATDDQGCLSHTLLPIDALLTDLPIFVLTPENCQNLFQGRKIFCPDQISENNRCEEKSVRLYTESGNFCGVGEMDTACYLKSKRLVNGDYFLNL